MSCSEMQLWHFYWFCSISSNYKNCGNSGHLWSPMDPKGETWCHQNDVFIYACFVDDRLAVSTCVGGAWNFTSVQHLWCFHFTRPTKKKRNSSAVSVQLLANIFLLPVFWDLLGCRNLPPEGFVYVYAHNPSSVCQWVEGICKSMMSFEVVLLQITRFHASMPTTRSSFRLQTCECLTNCSQMWKKFWVLTFRNEDWQAINEAIKLRRMCQSLPAISQLLDFQFSHSYEIHLHLFNSGRSWIVQHNPVVSSQSEV